MVFNRFWRADPARARTSGGTGLGLSISLEDTHLHGGWLQAWGRPGEGAQFRLTLPRRAGDAAAAEPAAAGARRTPRGAWHRMTRRRPRSPSCWPCCWPRCHRRACGCPTTGPVGRRADEQATTRTRPASTYGPSRRRTGESATDDRRRLPRRDDGDPVQTDVATPVPATDAQRRLGPRADGSSPTPSRAPRRAAAERRRSP